MLEVGTGHEMLVVMQAKLGCVHQLVMGDQLRVQTYPLSLWELAAHMFQQFLGPYKLKHLGGPELGPLLKELSTQLASAWVWLVFSPGNAELQSFFVYTSFMQHLLCCLPDQLILLCQPAQGAIFQLHSILCQDGAGWVHPCAYLLACAQAPTTAHFAEVTLLQSVPQAKPTLCWLLLQSNLSELDLV